MIVGNQFKELQGTRKYVSTNKESEPYGSKEDLAYWFLASRVSDTFGSEPATVSDIYYQVARPLGMSSSETARLVTGARRTGYLTTV